MSSLRREKLEAFARNTLSQLKSQFFVSLEEDNDKGMLLSQFHSAWEAFHEELERIHLYLSPETLDNISEFVSMMATVGSSLLEATSPDIVDKFKDNLIEEVVGPSKSARAAALPTGATPRYIESSIQWLRSNIHNPYPTRAIRSSIARDTKSSVKDVDAWFIDARKRIGWSQMRYGRFSNRKADIIDAATRFFTNSDPFRPLEDVVESEFAAVLSTVEEMYQEKCASSTLASRLDDTVRDLTPGLQVSLSKQKRRGRSEICHIKARRRRLHPYPTPERSPALSPTSLAASEPPSLALSTSNLRDGRRKRSRSPSTECPTDIEDEEIRPTKRTRHTLIPTLHTPATLCYPSPAASVVIDLKESPRQASVSAEISHTGKRKRTLSDSGVVHAPPPHESISPPQTSSNPPPLSVSEILDQAAFCPPSPSAASCAFGPFDPFFSAFMSGGAPTLGDTSSPLPLLNIVDDVAPTNVHVEFDQSWLSSSADALAPLYDTYATGYNTNFDNFGGNLYGESVDPFNCQLWYGDPPLHPLASAPCPESSTLAGQHDAPLPSPTGLCHASSPLPPSPASLPHAALRTAIDKARELEELEARCATLRSELAARR